MCTELSTNPRKVIVCEGTRIDVYGCMAKPRESNRQMVSIMLVAQSSSVGPVTESSLSVRGLQTLVEEML